MADDLHTNVFEGEVDVSQLNDDASFDEDQDWNREDTTDVYGTGTGIIVTSDPKLIKKAKRKEKLQQKKQVKKARLQENDVTTPRLLSPEEQLLLLLKHWPEDPVVKATTLELERLLNMSHMHNPNGCNFSASILHKLPAFRRETAQESDEKGCPLVVIVCSGAIRCTEVIQNVSKTLKCKIAKLFAKHFKVTEQVEALQKHFPVAVGTPNRLLKLIELGALSLSRCRLLVIDTAKDPKAFTVMTLPATNTDAYTLLGTALATGPASLQVALVSCKRPRPCRPACLWL